MERTETTLSAKEVIKLLMDELDQRGLLNREKVLQDKILRKKWITQKEIADSKIWGVDKGAVKVIVKNEVDPDSIQKDNAPYKIHRSEVERIALNRGTI